MPRDGSGVYSKPPGTSAVSGNTISSADYNVTIDDLVTDANAIRPIIAGGTGQSSIVGLRGVLNYTAATIPFAPVTGNPATTTQDAIEVNTATLQGLGDAAVRNVSADPDFASVDPSALADRSAIAAFVGTAAVVPLQTIDLTGLAQVDFTAFDAAEYYGYEFIFSSMINSVDAPSLTAQTSTDGGVTYDSTSGDYRWERYQIVPTNSGGADLTTPRNASASSVFIGDLGSLVGLRSFANITILDPDLAQETTIIGDLTAHATSSTIMGKVSGQRLSASGAVNGIQFSLISGTWTSGALRIYGHRR